MRQTINLNRLFFTITLLCTYVYLCRIQSRHIICPLLLLLLGIIAFLWWTRHVQFFQAFGKRGSRIEYSIIHMCTMFMFFKACMYIPGRDQGSLIRPDGRRGTRRKAVGKRILRQWNGVYGQIVALQCYRRHRWQCWHFGYHFSTAAATWIFSSAASYMFQVGHIKVKVP